MNILKKQILNLISNNEEKEEVKRLLDGFLVIKNLPSEYYIESLSMNIQTTSDDSELTNNEIAKMKVDFIDNGSGFYNEIKSYDKNGKKSSFLRIDPTDIKDLGESFLSISESLEEVEEKNLFSKEKIKND